VTAGKARACICVGLLSLAIAYLLPGCARTRDVRAIVQGPWPKRLSEWRLFVGSQRALQPNQGVLPYDLNTPLFSDYASKYRFVWMPAGTAARYREEVPLEFPVGTILAKTFAFPEDGQKAEHLIETRLLVHARQGWVGLPYVWDAAQQDAMLDMVPDPVPVQWTDRFGKRHDFTYAIPNANECHECHDNRRVMLPIGPKVRNLNKDYAYADGKQNQLERWQRAGYLVGLPGPEARPRVAQWDETASGSVEQRARAYLDNNCAHCHQPGGQAEYTGVDFRVTQTELSRLGACKTPNSAGNIAGLRYDLVPGQPDASILIYRLESIAPKISMPQLGRAVVHEEGVQLLREWVAELQGECGMRRAMAIATVRAAQ
jgi:uncharacterized repeat protein (TIGR03806 family)